MATTLPMTSLQPTATSRDRLGFGVFLALALHASLILGLNLKPAKPVTELELTVALQTSAAATPEQSAPMPEATTTMPPLQQSEPAVQSITEPKPQQPTLRDRFNRAQMIGQIACGLYICGISVCVNRNTVDQNVTRINAC